MARFLFGRALELNNRLILQEHGLRPTQPMRAVRSPSPKEVRAVIAASVRHGDATLEGTARIFNISPRTLQRHLGRMGTSHSELLADVRLNIACSLLVESSKRLSDIAKFVGYTNASSFSRTFVRLMKIQPVIYRQQQRARKQKPQCHRK